MCKSYFRFWYTKQLPHFMKLSLAVVVLVMDYLDYFSREHTKHSLTSQTVLKIKVVCYHTPVHDYTKHGCGQMITILISIHMHSSL